QSFMQHVANNLLFIFDNMPAEIRERAKLWYVGANKIAAERAKHYGLPDTSVAGVYAALSPQKDWFMNVSLGDRLLYTAMNHGAQPFTAEMAATAARIYGKPKYAAAMERVSRSTLNDLELAGDKAMWLRIFDETYNIDKQYGLRTHPVVTPEGEFAGLRMNKDGVTPSDTAWGSNVQIANAIEALLSKGNRRTISEAMGDAHKVRNFYNNIHDPWSRYGDVTIDTHAVGAGLLLPVAGGDIPVLHNLATSPNVGGWGILGTRSAPGSSVFGTAGLYGLYADAYRMAAAQRGVLPREMQSITWEGIRGLFPGEEKDVALKAMTAQLWMSGMPLNDIRAQIVRAGGGFRHPEWYGPRTQ